MFDSFIAERLERGAWPLLTVETEVQEMGTRGVQMKEILPWLVRWPCRAGTKAFTVLVSLV
jgi:hypothetical protein